jgi:hypothetical protein
MEINAHNLVFTGINPASYEKLEIQIVAAKTTVDNEKLYYFFYFSNLDEYDKNITLDL